MGITEQRQQLILAELQRDARVTVKALAERLHISTETIRRDLKELEQHGHARRVYGGAVIDSKEGDQPFVDRLRVNARGKARIGAAAMSFIEDGMKIFVDTGTTTLAFARHLVNRPKVSVHTNSIEIVSLLSGNPAADVTVLGGVLKPSYKALFGHQTVKAVQEHVYDAIVMSICTVHPAHGFMDFGEEEAVLRRAARAQGGRAIMLADSAKFGRLGSVRTFDLGEVDVLVTDAMPATEYLEQFSQSKVDVLHAQ